MLDKNATTVFLPHCLPQLAHRSLLYLHHWIPYWGCCLSAVKIVNRKVRRRHLQASFSVRNFLSSLGKALCKLLTLDRIEFFVADELRFLLFPHILIWIRFILHLPWTDVLFIHINKSRNEFRTVALGTGKGLQCAVIVYVNNYW
jgi:hypothetical protein